MKNYFNVIRVFLSLIIIVISVVIIFFSYSKINLDTSIDNLFPKDFEFQRGMTLTSKVNISNKIILYVEGENKEKLETAIDESAKIIDKYNLNLNSTIPSSNDVLEILKYCEANSLLLYPYEMLENPFLQDRIKKGLKAKENYIESNPFFYGDEEFFLDPLMMGFEVIKYINKNSGRYMPFKNGIIGKDDKSYIRIFNADFKNQDYDKVKILYDIDNELYNISKERGFISFLYSSHLYYYDSYTSIRKEVSIIFIFSIILTLLVFFIFFRRIDLVIYAFLPIVVSFSISFFIIAIFKKSYGGIALAFGATVSGIAIDYTIHYLSKASLYSTISDFRKKNTISMFLGWTTTIVVFLIIYLLSEIIALKEISLFAIISITISFFLSFFGLQKLIPPSHLRMENKNLDINLSSKFNFIIWLIIILFFLIGFMFMRFEDNVLNLDKKHQILDKRIALIKEKFLESNESLFLVFEGNSKEELVDKGLKSLKLLNNNGLELNFIPLLLFAPSENIIRERKDFIKKNFNKEIFYKELNNSNFTIDSFEKWIDNINNIEKLRISSMPRYLQNEIDNLFVDWGNRLYLMIFVENREKLNKSHSILKDVGIEHFTIDLFRDSGKGILKFEKNAVKLIFISFFIISLIILIVLRNIKATLLIVMSPLLSIISVLATSFYTGRGVNIMHIAASVIIMGISIDYSIYVTLSLLRERGEDDIKVTNRSILVSALTTIAGFGVLTFSTNQALFSLGSSIVVGISVALLTSFVAIPFLFRKIERYSTKV